MFVMVRKGRNDTVCAKCDLMTFSTTTLDLIIIITYLHRGDLRFIADISQLTLYRRNKFLYVYFIF